MIRASCGACLLASAVVAAAPRVSGRDAQPSPADAKTLRCEFTLAAAGTWNDSGPGAAVRPAVLSIGFESIEPDDGTADAVGQADASDTSVKVTSGTLHILQTFRSGVLYSTTVFNRELRPGRFKAVHSRHQSGTAGGPGPVPKPEQYYGDCQVGR